MEKLDSLFLEDASGIKSTLKTPPCDTKVSSELRESLLCKCSVTVKIKVFRKVKTSDMRTKLKPNLKHAQFVLLSQNLIVVNGKGLYHRVTVTKALSKNQPALDHM